MPWWLPTLVGVLTSISLGSWAWLSVSVVRLSVKLAEMETRISSREIESVAQLEWLRRVDIKMSAVGEDVAHIRGALEHLGIERRRG